MPDSSLVGTWTRATDADCSRRYPARIRFDERGIYFAEPDERGGFAEWDSGSFTVTALARVAISTANDAIVTYEFTLSGDTLRFVDPEGCRFEYRRAGS